MAAMTKRRIACFCDNVFEAELPTTIDVAERPAAVDEVLRGDFMAVSCPACGKRLTPEFPCLFTGVAAGPLGVLAVQLLPEADRVSFLAGRLGYDIGKPDRVVVGVPELAEKLSVFRHGLDDRAVEIVKYLLLTRPPKEGEAAPPAGELSVRFAAEEKGRLVFHIGGLREGELAVVRVERGLYARVLAELPQRITEEPYRDFCEPPWVSVRRVEREDGP